jgi:predicted Zn-dependent protease
MRAAFERAAKAEAVDPQSPFGYLNAAACYMYLDRLDEAAEALQRAARRKVSGPNVTPWRFHLAFLRGDEAAMDGSSRGPKVTRPSPT